MFDLTTIQLMNETQFIKHLMIKEEKTHTGKVKAVMSDVRAIGEVYDEAKNKKHAIRLLNLAAFSNKG